LYYHPGILRKGGEFFKDYCEAFQKNGIEVYVIAISICSLKQLTFSKILKSFMVKVSAENGIKVLRSEYLKLPKLERINAYLWSRKMAKTGNYFMRTYPKPDIVHVHSAIWAGLAATTITKKFQLPLVITEHRGRFCFNNPDAARLLKAWHNSVLKKIYGQKTQIITVSESIKNTIDSRFAPASKVEVIGNFVNHDFFKPLYRGPNKTFTFLTVADLEIYKGIDLLLDAFAILQRSYANTKLIIAGSGKMDELLKKKTDDLNLNNHVVFLGQLSKEQVRENMQMADVFVLPSRFEAFGVVIIEAMACGLPVIATKSGGPEDIISNENVGILVELNNPIALAKAMENMYNNYLNYDKTKIREYVIEHFSTDVIIQQYINVFNQLISTL
jgi:glycosyltransferase involved in cell wall biosynthesis